MRLIDADTLIARLSAEIAELRWELADPDTDHEVLAFIRISEWIEAAAKKGIDSEKAA